MINIKSFWMIVFSYFTKIIKMFIGTSLLKKKIFPNMAQSTSTLFSSIKEKRADLHIHLTLQLFGRIKRL